MSNLELFPLPVNYDGRTLGEVNHSLQEGTTEVSVYDGSFAYPNVSIDATRVIRSNCIAARSSTAFIERPAPLWKRAIVKTWNEGFKNGLELVVCEDIPQSGVGRWIGLFFYHLCSFFLWIINRVIQIYSSFYPFALLELDEQVKIFTRSLDWERGLVRAIKWHPSIPKFALALTNDDVLIYSSNTSIVPLIRHPNQKKVVDICWKDGNNDLIVVLCQSLFVIWDLSSIDTKEKARVPLSCSRVVHAEYDLGIGTPLLNAAFDPTGERLFICSPATSKIIMWKDPKTIDASQHIEEQFLVSQEEFNQKKAIEEESVKFIRKFGQGVFRLIWSPDKTRLLTLATSNYLRVFEKTTWPHREWYLPREAGNVVQAAVWSRPKGRFLLFCGRGDSSVYALPFYDASSPGHVGGEKESFKVLHLSEYQLPNGRFVGGAIQDMAWDKHSERLVISFRDHPSFLAVFRTSAKAILEIQPLGFIHGLEGERALTMDFHDGFTRGSLLTITWSSGFLSHIPFKYEPSAKKANSTSTPLAPRSLTTQCKSPLASPLASPIQRGVVSPIDRSLISPKTSSGQPSRHLLSSDSVMSPRRPTLFSCLKEN